jgi:hypothetical protein
LRKFRDGGEGCSGASSLADQADEALRDYRLWLAPVCLGSRVAYVTSLADGKALPHVFRRHVCSYQRTFDRPAEGAQSTLERN